MRNTLLLRSLAAMALAMSAAAGHASGFVSSASGTLEEIRFYTPGSTEVGTDVGVVEGSDGCTSANVCDGRLGFSSSYGGSFGAFGYALSDGLTFQGLTSARNGLGVVTSANVGSDQGVDDGESLMLLFDRPATIVEFVFFDVNGNPYTDTVTLLAEERQIELTPGQALRSPITVSEFTFVGGKQPPFFLGAIRLAAPVPEAGTLTLMAGGLLGVALAVRLRRRHAPA